MNANLMAWLLKIRGFMTKLADFMAAGRAAGAWDITGTPRFEVQRTGPQPFMGGVTGSIKEKIVEAGLRNVQKRIDTPEERKVIVDGIHIPGLPASFTWVICALSAVLTALMESASHSNVHLLATDWRAWLYGVVFGVDWTGLWMAAAAFIQLKIAFLTHQDSTRGTAVIPTEAVRTIAVKTMAEEVARGE